MEKNSIMDRQASDIKRKKDLKRKPRGRKIVRREKPVKKEIRKPQILGYMRVSTEKQDHALQRDALLKYGVPEENIFQDTISGSKVTREGRDRLLKHLVEGDTVVVWKLDRFSRSLKDILDKLEDFMHRGIFFVSLTQQIDTTTPTGRAMMQMIGIFAELERETIRERVKAGIQASRAAEPNKKWGRKASVDYDEKEILTLLKTNSVRAVTKLTGVKKSTVQAIKERNRKKGKK